MAVLTNRVSFLTAPARQEGGVEFLEESRKPLFQNQGAGRGRHWHFSAQWRSPLADPLGSPEVLRGEGPTSPDLHDVWSLSVYRGPSTCVHRPGGWPPV